MESKNITLLIIADVHGNLPALEAVLNDAKRFHPDKTIFLGDATGYGPYPDECVKLLSKICNISLIGNYDQKVLSFPLKSPKWQKNKHPLKYFAFEWAFNNLTEKSHSLLNRMPPRLQATFNDTKLFLCHGSPESISEHLTPETSIDRYYQLASTYPEQIILFGHSHIQFTKEIQGKLFLNPGSVGRPEGADPKACYAILKLSQDSIQYDLLKIDYDISLLLKKIKELNLPYEFTKVFTLGYNLDNVMELLNNSNNIKKQKDAAKLLLKSLSSEKKHPKHVCKLAMQLFPEFAKTYNLSEHEQTLLYIGALLHDIGSDKSSKNHNKQSAQIILDSDLPLDNQSKTIVSLIARYHRKSLPKSKHKLYSSLPEDEITKLNALISILRIADALDASHSNIVSKISCKIDSETVSLRIKAKQDFKEEKSALYKKSDCVKILLSKSLKVEFISK